MQNKRDFELAELEDDLSVLEQHAKHVVSLLGRRVGDLGERVAGARTIESFVSKDSANQRQSSRAARQALKQT